MRPPNCSRSSAHSVPSSISRSHAPAAAGGDVHALLDEPFAGQVEPLPHLAQHRVDRHRRVREGVLGMPVGEVVREVGIVRHLHPRQILVDDEQRRLALQPVHRPGQHQEVAGDVAVGDEPLLARQAVDVAVPHRLGADAARVGAGMLLGDRVGVAMVTAHVGQQVPLDLLRRAVDEHVGGAPDEHPEAVREPAQLLVHHDLLGQVEAGAAVLGGDVGGVQTRGQHRTLDVCVGLRRQPSAVPLGLQLQRLQHVVDQRPGAGPQLLQLGAEREIHSGHPFEAGRSAADAPPKISAAVTSSGATPASSG